MKMLKEGVFVRADVLRDFTAQYKTNYALERPKTTAISISEAHGGEISVGGNYQFDKTFTDMHKQKRSVGGKLKQDYRLDFQCSLRFLKN